MALGFHRLGGSLTSIPATHAFRAGAGGRQRDVELSGHSVVVDPWGEVVAEGGFDEEIVYADIDLGRVGAIRTEFPALADRVLT